jgi:hypothetical protein
VRDGDGICVNQEVAVNTNVLKMGFLRKEGYISGWEIEQLNLASTLIQLLT